MAFIGLNNLCPPATLYLVLSLAAIVMMALQNYGLTDQYCIGLWSCSNNYTTTIFLVKLLFIFFYTWVLNVICNRVSPIVSWVLVLAPIVLMFVGVSLVFAQHIDWARYPSEAVGYVRG